MSQTNHKLWFSVLLSALVASCGDETTTSRADAEPEPNDTSGATTDEDDVTFYRDVKPITDANCARCHTPDGVGYFDMTDAQTVVTWSGAIRASTSNRTMPPYGARATDTCIPEHSYVGDISLTDEEIETIAAWVEGGSKLGDPSDDTTEPVFPITELDRFDFEGKALNPISVNEGDDSFVCVVIDPGYTEETWINGVEVVPDNLKLAHHMVLFTDPNRESLNLMNEDGTYPCFGSAGVPGSVLYAWAPGASPLDLPSDKATRVEPGTLFVMQMHYSPQGGAETLVDQTKIRFRYLDEAPKYEVYMQLMGNFNFHFSPALGIQPPDTDKEDLRFDIPADTSMHREVMRWTFTGQLPGSNQFGGFDGPNANTMRLYSIAPHMHYTGVDMKIWIDRPAPGEAACETGMLSSAMLCGIQAGCPQDFGFVGCAQDACPEQFDALTLPCWGCAQAALQAGGANTQSELFACETRLASDDTAGRSTNECLLSAPNYSFEWQWNYPFDTPYESLPVFEPGSVLTLDCGYNNTLDNRLLAGALQRAGKSETQPVALGDETLDEMCLTVLTFIFERE